MKKIILIALMAYSFLAPFTYHPDTKLTLYYPSLDNGRVWNIYQYLADNVTSVPDFHYPPLHFLALKVEYLLIHPFGGEGFDRWLATGSFLGNENKLFSYIFLTKAPLIALTLLSGWLIYKLVLAWGKKDKDAKRALWWWFFNPITLFSVAVMGQNDIWAITIFLAGLLLCLKKPWLGFAVMGLSAGIKSYPLVWIGLLGLAGPFGKWQKKVGLVLTSVLVYVLALLPFLRSDGFVESVLGSGLMNRLMVANIEVGFGEAILIGPMLLMIVILTAIKTSKEKLVKLMWWLMATGLVMLGWSHFHIQWLLWLVPFWTIYSVMSKEKSSYWLMALVWLAGLGVWLLFDDVFLSWGLVSPIKPELMNWPTIFQALSNKGLNVSLLINGFHTILAALSVVAILWGVL